MLSGGVGRLKLDCSDTAPEGLPCYRFRKAMTRQVAQINQGMAVSAKNSISK